MEQISAERETLRPNPGDGAARKRAAVEIYAQNEATLRRTARRYSLCADDVEEALQRSLEILLTKAPDGDPRELIKWTQTVVKHEALGVRRERERILSGPAAAPDGEDWVASVPAVADGPAEQTERREEIARSREALQALKPQELRALTLFGEGYSYAEIGEITNWSHTKINRCLAEGRERFRRLVARSEAGERCAELRPLLSSFCDGEVDAAEVAKLREHLRACGHCRATLRAYRAAPKAAAAFAPFLPIHRSLWERAQEALSGMADRVSGGGGDAASQVAAGGGAAAFVKVAAICIGTAGGAAACVAGGLVQAPLGLGDDQQQPRVERLAGARAPDPEPAPAVEYEPAEPEPQPSPDPKPKRQPDVRQPVETEPAPSEPAAVEPAPVESAPVAEPVSEPAPSESGGGSPAGEFGP